MHHVNRQPGRRSGAASLAVALCLALGSLPAHAADGVLPNAGTLLQDMKRQSEASSPKGESLLRILPTPDVELPLSAPFEVKQLRITGNTIFETDTLHVLVAPLEGKRLTLAQLDEGIGALTEFYRQAGYPLARAIIPAQTIAGGGVTIQIIEARLGAIVLDNHSAIHSEVLQRTLTALQPGEVISQTALDQAMLQLSELPGIVPGALLRPGQAVGSSDLALNVQPGAATTGDVLVDNYGGRYTGRERVGVNLQWNNPLHRGDVLGLSSLSSGSDLNYARLSYEVPLDGQGSYLGGAASSLQYGLGDSAASLQAHGSAQQGSVWLRKYLVHSPAGSLGLRLQYDPVTLRDEVDSTASRNDRHVELWSLELQAQAADTWLGGGYNTASLAVRAGQLGFDDDVAESADAQLAQTKGLFTHWGLTWGRTQTLWRGSSLAISFNGQWAQSNLDASQKFSLGGARNVRAYESGVLSGDSGQSLTLEWSQLLPVPAAFAGPGLWKAIAFWDAGTVQINQRPWTTGSNDASLSGAGLGLNWQGPRQLHARISYAVALGNTPSQLNGSASKHASTWVEVGMGF